MRIARNQRAIFGCGFLLERMRELIYTTYRRLYGLTHGHSRSAKNNLCNLAGVVFIFKTHMDSGPVVYLANIRTLALREEGSIPSGSMWD